MAFSWADIRVATAWLPQQHAVLLIINLTSLLFMQPHGRLCFGMLADKSAPVSFAASLTDDKTAEIDAANLPALAHMSHAL